MTTIYRGLMNAATTTPNSPAARLRAFQQRAGIPGRASGGPQGAGGIIPPHMQQPRPSQAGIGGQTPAPQQAQGQPQRAPSGLPPRQGNTGIVPPNMQTPRPAQAGMSMAAVPQGLYATAQTPPSASSGINPKPGSVAVPDVARAPGVMNNWS